MKLHLHMALDNAAFENYRGEETARILHKAAEHIKNWPGVNEFSIGLFDLNGNKVGSVIAETD